MSKKIIRISESQIPERLRGNRNILLKSIGKMGINLSGWTIKGMVPDEERIVIIAAPHTSNWDFILAMMAIFGLNIKIKWLGKDSIFKPGFKWFFNFYCPRSYELCLEKGSFRQSSSWRFSSWDFSYRHYGNFLCLE